jgi:hypothetical protein
MGWILKVAFVLAATALAWFNVAAAMIAVAATILVVLFDRAKDIVDISFGPMKAKIERDLSEAEKLVNQLRDFSTLQAQAVLAAAVRSGRFADESGWLFNHVKALETAMREMGVPESRIAEARQEFVGYAISDAGHMAMGHGHIPNVNGKFLEAEWREALGKFPNRDPDKIEGFLHRHGLINAERKKRVDDMRWMMKHGDVRDSEMYLRTQTPVPWND